MKKIIILVFIFITTITSPLNAKNFNEQYKVIKIVDADTVYIDFNKNELADKDERVRIDGIDAFEVTVGHRIYYQMKKYNLSLEEALGLGYLGMKFAEKNLLNKYIEANYSSVDKTDKYNRRLMSVKYDNNKDYSSELLKAGLAVIYTNSALSPSLKKFENIKTLKKNILKTKELKLVLINCETEKCHKVNCKYAQMAKVKKLIDISQKKSAQYAKCCEDK